MTTFHSIETIFIPLGSSTTGEFVLPLYMYRKYQINWLLILSLGMILGTILLAQVDLNSAKWWYFLNHTLKVFLPMAACWLIHGFFLTNNFERVPSYIKPLLSILSGLTALLIIGLILDLILPPNYLFSKEISYDKASDISAHIIGNTLLSLLLFIVFSNRHTSFALKKSNAEKDLLEKAHLKAQLVSLQQQISPHFLFNSLSTLKTMVNDEAAKDYIVELAGVYRYVLSFNERYLTALEDEIKFINSYLHILRERFQDALQVNINILPQYKNSVLPSLALQLLIENAIKHNICSTQRPLYISIFTTDSGNLMVVNNFQPKKARAGQPGTGLKNIVERYKLLAGRSVEVTQDNEKFSVTIPLLEHESYYNRR